MTPPPTQPDTTAPETQVSGAVRVPGPRDQHERARLHLLTLTAAGWSLRAIAGATGVPATVLSRYRRGLEQHRYDVPVKVLAVDATAIPRTPSKGTTEPFVSRVGTVRRIQALLAMGWRHQDINERLGAVRTNRSALLLAQQGRWVTRSTHDRVAAIYRELANRRGPSERTRARARKLGYATPAQWDDIDRDEAPETGPEYCEVDGCLKPPSPWYAGNVCDAHGREAGAA